MKYARACPCRPERVSRECTSLPFPSPETSFPPFAPTAILYKHTKKEKPRNGPHRVRAYYGIPRVRRSLQRGDLLLPRTNGEFAALKIDDRMPEAGALVRKHERAEAVRSEPPINHRLLLVVPRMEMPQHFMLREDKPVGRIRSAHIEEVVESVVVVPPKQHFARAKRDRNERLLA